MCSILWSSSSLSQNATCIFVCLIGLTVRGGEIVAHRGASHDAPENTLRAVRLAWEQGADAVEIDLRLSQDGHIVVMHDDSPKRYGGPDRKLSQMTWEEIQSLDVGAWKDRRYKGEKVPLLEDILRTVPAGRRLFLEIKDGPETLTPLAAILQQSKLDASQLCIISFQEAVMQKAAELFPQHQRYLLIKIERKNGSSPPDVKELIDLARRCDAHGLDIGGDIDHVTEAFVQQLAEARLECFIWTVNDPRRAQKLWNIGVQGITTDRPELLSAGEPKAPPRHRGPELRVLRKSGRNFPNSAGRFRISRDSLMKSLGIS